MSYNKRVLFIFFLSFSFLVCQSCKGEVQKVDNDSIVHGIVFQEEGQFGGWPANNGIWNWGDEILVGFVQADHKELDGLHTYDRETATNKYARSFDGGVTWSIEDAYKHGQKSWAHDNNVHADKAITPMILTKSIPDFTNPEFIITFMRHNNNNGPTHFYYSKNKGKEWNGAYWLPEMGADGIASRTDYIVEGERELIAFVTVAKKNKREGRVAMTKTVDGGVNWEIVSWLGDEPEGFDIMSSTVKLSDSSLLSIIRSRTGTGQDLLSGYKSTDHGKTWRKLKDPVADTGRGGTPPALLQLKDGRLALAYAYRSNYESRINIRFSSDEGETWSDEIILRSGDGANRDCGYPRMVQRKDGKLVVIYYWNNANNENSKPYRYIASTTFDPDQLK